MSTEAINTNEHDDEDAAFAAGFDNQPVAPADEVAAAGSDAPTQAAKDDAQAAPSDAAASKSAADEAGTENKAPAVDPFDGLPQAVRDLLGKIPTLETVTNEAMQRARTAEGRAAALQSRLDKMSNGNTAAEQAPARPQRNRIQALRDQGLPEIADALEELADAIPTKPAKADEDQGKAQEAQQTPTKTDDDPQTIALTIARPNWATEVVSSDFALWLTTQPAEFQQRIARTDKASDLMNALTAFDQRPKPQPTAPRASRMAAGVTPTGDGRRPAARGRTEDVDEDAAMEAGFRSVGR